MRWVSATAGRSRLAALAASAVAAGCSFTADPGAARFACDSLTVCPDGVACVDGYCQVAAGEAAGDAATSDQLDGGGQDDGGDPSGPLAWRSVAVGSADNTLVDRITTEQALSGQPGDVYVAFVSTKPAHEVSSLSGLGLDWHELRQQCSGRSTASLAVFWARANGQANGRVTASLPGVGAAGSILLAVHRYAGGDPDDPIGSVSSANSNGADSAADCFGGNDSAGYSWSNLDTGAPGSVVVSGAHTANYGNHTPGDAFIERSDDQSGDTSSSAGVAVEDRRVAAPTADVTVSGGWPGEEPDWAAVAVELRD
jgi:hypothetical protein